MELRSTAKYIFDETQRRLELPKIIRQEISLEGGLLKIGHLSYRLESFRRVVLIATGKAAVPMADAVMSIVGPKLTPSQALEGIVVGTTGSDSLDPRLHFLPGGHPTPDEHSIAAADAILSLLSSCDDSCLVLILLSGGASSMVEKPLDPAMNEVDVANFHRALVHSGLPIGEMNTLRKHFSAVKGGRLALAAPGVAMCTLIVSDVPPGAMHVVGSGPTLPDPSTTADCRAILATHAAALDFDEKLTAYFENPALAETPKEGNEAFRKAECHLLLSSDNLCTTAQQVAQEKGFEVVVDNSCDEWDFRSAAQYLVNRMAALVKSKGRVCLVSTGEIAVPLQDPHGLGGRNQHFVLECIRLADEQGLDITVLSGGSDGIDGNSPAAGAVADRTTADRAAAFGLTIEGALASFDSYSLFEAVGDAIVTGPTGNNLRDLRVLLAN